MTIETVAGKLEDAHLPYLLEKSDQREEGATFKLANPLNPKKPFDLKVTVVKSIDTILLVVPAVANAKAGSGVMCAAIHSNYEYYLGRFGWDPRDGEIRYFSDSALCGGPEGADAQLSAFIKLVPMIVKGFFMGMLRIYLQEVGEHIPEEMVKTLADTFEQKLTEWKLIGNASEGAGEGSREGI